VSCSVAARCKQHLITFPVSCTVAARCKQHLMTFPVSCTVAARCKQHFILLYVTRAVLHHVANSILRYFFQYCAVCFIFIHTYGDFGAVYWAWVRKGDQKIPKRNSISTAAAQWSDIAPHAGTALGVPSCGHMKDRSTDARGREMYSQGCNFAVFLSPAAHEEWDRSGAGEPSPLLYTTTRAWRERRRDEGRGLGKSAESEFWIWGWRQ